MPLITCPDCGGAVSEAAPACIHCGRPMIPAAGVAGAAADPSQRRERQRTERVASTRTIAIIVYVLQVLAFLYFIPGIVGVVLAYLKRGEARGTWVESHFDWQIGTFWISLWLGVAAVLTAVLTGLTVEGPLYGVVALSLIGIGATVWYVYRIIRGALALNDNRPVG